METSTDILGRLAADEQKAGKMTGVRPSGESGESGLQFHKVDKPSDRNATATGTNWRA